MDEYGFHHGDVWYRGRFTTTGKATALALNANTGPTGQYAVWLNGSYLGSSGDGAHTFDIPAGTLKAGTATTSWPCSPRTRATTRNGATTTPRSRAVCSAPR